MFVMFLCQIRNPDVHGEGAESKVWEQTEKEAGHTANGGGVAGNVADTGPFSLPSSPVPPAALLNCPVP